MKIASLLFLSLLLCENANGCFTYTTQSGPLHTMPSNWIGLEKLGSADSKEKRYIIALLKVEDSGGDSNKGSVDALCL